MSGLVEMGKILEGPITRDPATDHAAALYVCEMAVDVDEAREWLAMLGIGR